MARGSLTLAIETSNPSAGPRGAIPRERGSALLAGPGVALGGPLTREFLVEHGFSPTLGVELLRGDSTHDDDLMPAIDRLCTRSGAAPADIGTVAVSIGPGGYTALRVAIATAKMIAAATGARTVPVPSACVAAWCLPFSLAPAIVCLASKGDATHGTLLPAPRVPGDWWDTIGRAALAPLVDPLTLARTDEELGADRSWIAAACPIGIVSSPQVESLRPRTLIADRFLPDSIRAAAERIGAAIVEPILAPESVLRLSQGLAPIDPLELSPLYPREPEAVTLWRRTHGTA